MACKDCEERRRKLQDAVLRGKLCEAVGHAVAGVKEMFGGMDRNGSATMGAGDQGTANGGRPGGDAGPSRGDDADGAERGQPADKKR